MTIKVDENLPERLVAALAALGHDVDTVRAEHLAGRVRLIPSLKQWSEWSLPSKLSPKTSMSEDRLFVHCQTVVMRMVMPPQGHIYVLRNAQRPG